MKVFLSEILLPVLKPGDCVVWDNLAVHKTKAVQELFKVKVLKVNTLNVRGKDRRQRTKQAGRSSNWKKAIVTLKQGDRIELT